MHAEAWVCKCEKIYKGERPYKEGEKIMSKKVLAFLLTLCLVISCVPTLAFATVPGPKTIGENVLEVRECGNGYYRVILTMKKEYTEGSADALQMGFKFDKDFFTVESTELKNAPTLADESAEITSVSNANADGEIIACVTTDGTNVNLAGDIQLIVNMKLKDNITGITTAASFTVSDYQLDEYNADNGASVPVVGLNNDKVSKTKLDTVNTTYGTVTTAEIAMGKETAEIKGNVLNTIEEYDVIIIYDDNAVYTYIPEDAEVNGDDCQNPEQKYDTDSIIKGKWCGYGDASTNKGFDGSQNRITIINGMNATGTITADTVKDAGIESDSFSIAVKATDQVSVDGENYATLRDACKINSSVDVDAVFDLCKATDGTRFGKYEVSTKSIQIDGIDTASGEINYVNLYYSLTGDPGKGVAKYVSGGGNTASTKLGTITITVKAA